MKVKSHFERISAPSRFALEQNFPNPFNPATTIKYSVPKSSFVTLKVYDLLGNEVFTLVNGEKSAGYYQLQFYASNLASGVYFYRLTPGDKIEVKKLLLAK
jgi:Secretion system C-terminal sorting domain